MSTSPKNNTTWVYRIFDRRTVSVKAKNDGVRKIAAVDLQTNFPIAIDVPEAVSLQSIELGNAYVASLKVYTARDVEGVPPENVAFFKVLDVDQSIEDFIKAYWIYPKLIKFELVEVESM
ncbi:MAG: hypothetical protein ACBZ72_00460 [Candidatus Bathyarchaeia archaeon]